MDSTPDEELNNQCACTSHPLFTSSKPPFSTKHPPNIFSPRCQNVRFSHRKSIPQTSAFLVFKTSVFPVIKTSVFHVQNLLLPHQKPFRFSLQFIPQTSPFYIV